MGDERTALERHWRGAERIAAAAGPARAHGGESPVGGLAGQVLAHAGDTWDRDAAEETKAIAYVRDLEAVRAVAADMLSRFVRTSDGYRARVGQVQLSTWAKLIGKVSAEQ
jgi:hypothetical protein